MAASALILAFAILGSRIAVVCHAPTFATTDDWNEPVREEDRNEVR
jgi:hypothetical protein